MKTILITGSSGFIGKNLKQALSGHCRTLCFNSRDGDIASTKLPFTGVDYVVHLAGKSFVPDSWKQREEFFRVNVEGTRNVLAFCAANSVPMMLMSSYIYGIPEKLPVDELHPVHPPNPYAESKFEAEKICGEFDVPVTIVRPFNIYGPGQSGHYLIPTIISQVIDRSVQKIELNDLAPRRDYLFMDDFIRALCALIEGSCTGIFNVGSGYSLSVREIAEIILHIAGVQKEVHSSGVVRQNEIPDVIADISKIKHETGWEPVVSFDNGIQRILSSQKRTFTP